MCVCGDHLKEKKSCSKCGGGLERGNVFCFCFLYFFLLTFLGEIFSFGVLVVKLDAIFQLVGVFFHVCMFVDSIHFAEMR